MFKYRVTKAERTHTLPGDSIIAQPVASWTRGITITAPPSTVWPWIAQLGADRAGWYSYDFIDNGGKPSSKTILPEFQEVDAGQIFPALPGADDAFVVAEVEHGNNLVLIVPGPQNKVIVSWAFVLETFDTYKTRLIIRAKISDLWRQMAQDVVSGDDIKLIHRIYGLIARLPSPIMIGVAGFGHGIMERRMLSGIKRRSESGK
jgi:hypothetical protein